MKPIALTLGDPAGIGPEVAARVLASGIEAYAPIVLVGNHQALGRGAEVAGVRLPDIPRLQSVDALVSGGPPGPLSLLEVAGELSEFEFGRVQAHCGAVAVAAVEQAATLCLNGSTAAMVTCPINKAAIHAAGYVDDIGHQEILARLAGVTSTATLLMTPGLKVVHLSTHLSLIEAARFVKRETVLARLVLINETFRDWGMPDPRIAVAALNPHGGESGLLGREEIDEIAPAVDEARGLGLDVSGPVPADSVFTQAIDGKYDVVLALYHDQGHIAIKVHDFHRSTTATLGLPFIRTSVDHGTAFDIAGRGVADPTGLAAALTAARALANGELGRL